MNRIRSAPAPAVIVAASLALAWVLSLLSTSAGFDWNSRLDDSFFRLRYALQGPQKMASSIAHVDVTDSMVEELGMKGGDRTDFGRLVDVLSRAGVSSIVFDIMFPQPGTPAGDAAFVAQARKAGTVYLPAITRTDEIDAVAGRREPGGDPLAAWLWHPRLVAGQGPAGAVSSTASFAALTSAARGIGIINSEPDQDGILRRMPLVAAYRGGIVPCLALRAACDVLGVDPATVEVSFGHRVRLPRARMPDGRVRDIDIPIDRAGRMIIDFAGPWGASFPHYSFAALLQAEHDPGLADSVAAELENSHLVISDLTTSSSDYGAVPMERVYPRSGIHANILNSILTDRFLRAPFRRRIVPPDAGLCRPARGGGNAPAPPRRLAARAARLDRPRGRRGGPVRFRRHHAGAGRADPRVFLHPRRGHRVPLSAGRARKAADPNAHGALLRAPPDVQDPPDAEPAHVRRAEGGLDPFQRHRGIHVVVHHPAAGGDPPHAQRVLRAHDRDRFPQRGNRRQVHR